MEISNFMKYFVYWKISLVMLLENIITSDVIGKYIMGRLTNIGKYSSWSLILEASLHKIYCSISGPIIMEGIPRNPIWSVQIVNLYSVGLGICT